MIMPHQSPALPPIVRRGCLALAIAVIAWCGNMTTVTAETDAAIFRSTEIRKDGLRPFPKWTGALEKYFQERANAEGGCEAPEFNRCHYEAWQTFIDSLRDRDLKTQLKEVNRFMNRRRYITDPINWGVKDYWESPGEFFEKYGDCEDYSIAKFLTLRALGINPDNMRIVIVMDLNLNVQHAVLGVYQDGKILVLDNQLSIVVEDRRIRHYRPLYSVNETGWWKHRAL